MNKTKQAALIIGFLVLLGIAGHMDYQDQLAEEEHYCEMVAAYKAGSHLGWPDFKGIYQETCLKPRK